MTGVQTCALPICSAQAAVIKAIKEGKANVDISTPTTPGGGSNPSGGYKYCKAIGVMLEDRNIAQVSINMVNLEKFPLYRVFETVRFEAKRYGVGILGSEVIGLAPAKALIDAAEYYLQIEDFDYGKQVLENHLLG